MSMIQEIEERGVERQELAIHPQTWEGRGERIPYEPAALAGIITQVRAYGVRRYLAIEGVSAGGWRYIKDAAGIADVNPVLPQPIQGFCKALRQLEGTFDLVSIDARNLPIPPDEIWKFMLGGKEQVKTFGAGAPRDYGMAKVKPGTLVLLNLAGEGMKDLYMKLRTQDNRMHQSKFAGMVKWA